MERPVLPVTAVSPAGFSRRQPACKVAAQSKRMVAWARLSARDPVESRCQRGGCDHAGGNRPPEKHTALPSQSPAAHSRQQVETFVLLVLREAKHRPNLNPLMTPEAAACEQQKMGPIPARGKWPSTRRPAHAASAQDMAMQVGHGFAGVRPVVEDQAIAALLQAE